MADPEPNDDWDEPNDDWDEPNDDWDEPNDEAEETNDEGEETNDDWDEFVKGKTISQCVIDGDKLILSFNETASKIVFQAYAEYDSISWFQTYNDVDFDTIIGKEVIGINEDTVKDYPESNEYDSYEVINIKFKDDSIFHFMFRHSSDGYYSGWYDFKIVRDSTEEPLGPKSAAKI